MGKSFNDDVFNNGLNLESINGLSISREAIEENIKKKAGKDFNKVNTKEEFLEAVKGYETEAIEKAKDYNFDNTLKADATDDKTYYTKKTMIFKQEYLDIIDGLAKLNNMQIKDVLNELLGQGIEQLKLKDDKIIDKAVKEARKNKSRKTLF